MFMQPYFEFTIATKILSTSSHMLMITNSQAITILRLYFQIYTRNFLFNVFPRSGTLAWEAESFYFEQSLSCSNGNE